jgi:hypothetical protein
MSYEEKKWARINAQTAYQLKLITWEKYLEILRSLQDL